MFCPFKIKAKVESEAEAEPSEIDTAEARRGPSNLINN